MHSVYVEHHRKSRNNLSGQSPLPRTQTTYNTVLTRSRKAVTRRANRQKREKENNQTLAGRCRTHATYLDRYTFNGSMYLSNPRVLIAHRMSSPLMVLRFSRWHLSDASEVIKETNSDTHSWMVSFPSFATLAEDGSACGVGSSKRAERAQNGKHAQGLASRPQRRRVSGLKDRGLTRKRADAIQPISSWRAHNQNMYAKVRRGSRTYTGGQTSTAEHPEDAAAPEPAWGQSSGGWPAMNVKHTFFMMRAMFAVGRYLSSSLTDPSSSPPPVPAPASAITSAGPPPSAVRKANSAAGYGRPPSARTRRGGKQPQTARVGRTTLVGDGRRLGTSAVYAVGLQGGAARGACATREVSAASGAKPRQCKRGLERGPGDQEKKMARSRHAPKSAFYWYITPAVNLSMAGTWLTRGRTKS